MSFLSGMIRASLLYYNYTLLVINNQYLLKHKDVRNKNSPECIRTVVCIWGQNTKVVLFALKSWGVFTLSDTPIP